MGVVWSGADACMHVCVYRWLETSVRPVVTTEWQLLLVLHVLGPILNRLTSEKPKLLLEVCQSLDIII